MCPSGLLASPEKPSTTVGTFEPSPVQFARYKLSGGGFNNLPMPLASGSATPTLIHECSSTAIDEPFIYASNYSTSAADLYLGIGSDVSGSQVRVQIPASTGLVQVYPGIPHQGISIVAWSNQQSAISLSGYILRYYLNDPSTDKFGYDGTE